MADLVIDSKDLDTDSKTVTEATAISAEPIETPPTPPATPATPPAEPPATPPATPPAIPPAPPVVPPIPHPTDELKMSLLKEIFGDTPPTADQAKKIISEYPNLTKQVEELQSKQVKFANSYIEGLNDYLSKGGTKDAYDRVQALDLENLNGIDAVKAKYKWDHPELTDAQIDRKLNKLYNQGEDASDEEKEDGLIDLTIDAKKAKEELSKIKVEQSIPDPERLRIAEEKQEAERVQAWAPTVGKLVTDFNDFDIPLAFDDKGAVTDSMKYTAITPEVKTALLADLRKVIEASGVPHTAEEVRAVQSVMHERFIVRNFKSIMSSVATEMKTRADAAARKEYHNGEAPPSGDKPPAALKATNEDEIFERLMGGR